jgi:hypothetical protein
VRRGRPRRELASRSCSPRVFEDFYGTYGGALGIPSEVPEGADLPGLPGWFFLVPAAGQLVLAWLALRIGLVARVRPELLRTDDAFEPLGVALLIAGWTVDAVVAFPRLDGPPFRRLFGTWVAVSAAVLMCVGLVGLASGAARDARSRGTANDHVN